MQADTAPETLVFGPFTLDSDARALSAGGQKLALSSRAFDILMLLLTHRDRVVSKDEIIATVWRGVSVEENNLAVQVSALRRALAEHSDSGTMILTVPGQGYRFVGRVSVVGARVADDRGGSVSPESSLALLPSRTMSSGRMRPRILAATAGAVAIGALALLWITWRAGPVPSPHREAPRLSLAVLPFRNLGDDTKQNYLADAISDDLTTDLSHLPGSVVIARASSDSFKGRSVPAEQIGQALNVRYLLEGSLRGEDGIFRINAQLIDAATGAHLWADRFDVSRDKMSDAQSAIVRHIASALNVTLVAIESARSIHDRPNDPDALDLYFRARSVRDQAETLTSLTRAQHLLEQAIALQPEFVDALIDLGDLLLNKRWRFDDPDDAQDLEHARQIISQALTLAPKNVGALTVQGLLKTVEGDYQAAEASYKAALVVDNNNVTARAGYASAEWLLGDAKATVATLKEVMRVDPLGPRTKSRFATLGMAYFMLGSWNETISSLMDGLAGDPEKPAGSLDRIEFSNLFLIAAYDQSGNTVRAREAYASYKSIWPDRTIWRLESYFSKAQSKMPGFGAFRKGLLNAGMPEFADPHVDRGIVPSDQPQGGGDFDPTPTRIPGGTVIDSASLKRMLSEQPDTTIVDVGSSGAAVLPKAVFIRAGQDRNQILDVLAVDHAQKQIIVVMSGGTFGWQGYDAALRLINHGRKSVVWYRGGEEAWASQSYPSEDQRSP